MLYAILCYHDEAALSSKTRQQDDALMSDLHVVQGKLMAEGKLGPHARLVPTKASTTLRYTDSSLVVDGPFAETKEQLLGFYVVDCATHEEAVEIAHRLAGPRIAHGFGPGALEIRPIGTAVMGSLPT
jgi:hypothetical protein